MRKQIKTITKTAALLFAAFFVATLAMTGCGLNGESTHTFFCMDTTVSIKLYATGKAADEAFAECEKIAVEIENILSKTIPESDIARLNANGFIENANSITVNVMKSALEAREKTDGAFDITVGGLVSLWERCGNEGRIPGDYEISELLLYVGEGMISIDGEGKISKADTRVAADLGGIGKGYALGAITEYLKSTAIPGGIVSFGGNISAFGKKSDGTEYKIAIKNPLNPSEAAGYLNISGGVVAVSGDYERYITVDGKKYHHIIDPATGKPAESGLHSVAVYCDDATEADILSTALFVMGEEKGIALYESGAYDFEAVFIGEGKITVTDGLTNKWTETEVLP